MSPHFYYNAITLFHQGNYQVLAALWNEHHDWHAAWNQMAGAAQINPEREWRRLVERDVHLLLPHDTGFPSLLKEIPHAPFGIYSKGPFIFNPPTLAVVGTRRATSEGKRIAEQLSHELARQGITIVSGLALGIDGAAHRGALQASGKTIAVFPVGLDRIYPPHHTGLAEQIVAQGGCCISEYPFGTPALPYRFLERNRIVSGLSLGTLIIEAPLDSGARVTARLAAEQNREVLVVPGPINHPNYHGSHHLIREGATLITCTQDICEHLNIPLTKNSPENNPARSPHEQRVVACIRDAGGPITLDTIMELTKLESHAVHHAITLLIISGILKEANGMYSL